MLIVTRAGSPLKSVQDVVAAARANPGKLNIGTINPGSTQNLAAELFTSTAGIKTAIVPFRTSPDMAGAVMRGDVDVAFEFYAAINGLLADREDRGAGVHRRQAHGLSAGRSDRHRKRHQGLRSRKLERHCRSRPPRRQAVIATLNQAMKDVIPGPDVQSRSRQMGMEMRWSTPEDMTARMKADIAKWGAVIEKAGIPKRD